MEYMSFKFEKTKILEVILVKSPLFEDTRGFFMETYKYSEFSDNGIKVRFVQENHSYSKKNVLRGLHYQANPKSQGKLVRCIRGEIFDVAVDIRPDSSTYKKWVGVVLSEKNRDQLYIPAGFAHGFCVTSDIAEVIYKCTEEYSPQHERGIIWNDSAINILWPINSP